MGHMGGQLFVRAVEAPESLPTRTLAEGQVPSFLRLRFDEALRAFLGKRIMTPEAFRALSDALRLRAWTATNLASEQLTHRAFAALRAHLDQGGSLGEFVRQVRAGEAALGVEPASPFYLELLYRNSVNGAYGMGRLAQMEHPAVLAARPLVQFRTSGDSRVRPAHRLLHGLVFDRSQDPGWRRLAPPLGHACRCAMVTVRSADKITPSDDLPPGAGPDPGWTGPGMG